MRVVNGVLLYQVNAHEACADVTWTTTRKGLLSIVLKNQNAVMALIKQDGNPEYLLRLLEAVTDMSEHDYRYFNIIEP